MTSILGQEVCVILEMPDGTIFTGQALAAEYTIDISVDRYPGGFIRGLPTWTLNLIGDGRPLWHGNQDDYIAAVSSNVFQDEWKCPWCDEANWREHRTCIHCGARRSVLYDICKGGIS